MRFMMFMYPGLEHEGDWEPTVEAVAAMSAYNEELTKAGILLSLDGWHPSSEGARVSWPDGRPTVTDGPFTETKELIGGYWLIQVASKEEAVQWATRIPGGGDAQVEVRRVWEMADFPSELQAAAGFTEPSDG